MVTPKHAASQRDEVRLSIKVGPDTQDGLAELSRQTGLKEWEVFNLLLEPQPCRKLLLIRESIRAAHASRLEQLKKDGDNARSGAGEGNP